MFRKRIVSNEFVLYINTVWPWDDSDSTWYALFLRQTRYKETWLKNWLMFSTCISFLTGSIRFKHDNLEEKLLIKLSKWQSYWKATSELECILIQNFNELQDVLDDWTCEDFSCSLVNTKKFSYLLWRQYLIHKV